MGDTEIIESTENAVENMEAALDPDDELEVISTESETEVEEGIVEDTAGESQTSISLENIEVVMNETLTEYFATAPVQAIIVDSDNGGVDKPIEEFTLVEVCLVIIVMILLGRAILDIIGGKAWNK